MAWFIVRAEVREADRAAFDAWYRDEHLPQAFAAFVATSAWRGWSDTDPSIHYAYYEFPDLATVRAMAAGEGLRRMIGAFDRRWQGRVTRSRDIVETAQTIGG
ncbi:MAG: hypothetical protein AB7N54_09770 [Alphaproteobacteria bacterium]